jgi:hypothetical protein
VTAKNGGHPNIGLRRPGRDKDQKEQRKTGNTADEEMFGHKELSEELRTDYFKK